MSWKTVSIVGLVIAIACLWLATMLYPGGYDWNRDYISTLVRGDSGPARLPADAGVILFCLSLALIFERLARLPEFSKNASLIRTGGIGSMVYSCLAITPLHDLVVMISIPFFLIAVLALSRSLYAGGERGFLVAGCACLLVFAVSSTIYYSGRYTVVRPWAQRLTCTAVAVWLLAMDFRFPRVAVAGS